MRWLKIEKENNEIEWDKFEDRYVKLFPDIEKRLRLSNWRGGTWFGKPGISFDVGFEDGRTVQKQFTATSRSLIRLLKPILVKADANNQSTVSVSILRTGEGFDTRYTIKELPPSFKELFKR